VDLSRDICSQARIARDARFDGRFFIAVRTTKIYCRPICPVHAPKESNIDYYPSAAAAAEAGFRPCLRCRPETSPGTPAWIGAPATVSRALKLIGEGALDEASVEHLANRVGMGARHLRRLFLDHLGATPVAIAQTRRLHFAKRLIDETSLPFTGIVFSAGFSSVRRFNATFQSLYGRSPTELRRLAQRKAFKTEPGEYVFALHYRPPYDFAGLLDFLRLRSLPGIETVLANSYERRFQWDGHEGWFRATQSGGTLQVRVRYPEPRHLLKILERIRHLLDLTADSSVIGQSLSQSPLLAPRVALRPGLRVPGAWDPFELAVRAILGQQVSVKAATTMATRIVDHIGGGWFPSPAVLAQADLTRLGVIRQRAAAIKALAESGGVDLHVPGIGEWTRQYIAMRAGSEPDSFPSADLVLLRAAGVSKPKQLEALAEAWRPWRSYAAMYLWQVNLPGHQID
jgi:AraC family transcriptional regulator, regulatory protein of adaptative response / DNA-3-methyladenine glycosylase II